MSTRCSPWGRPGFLWCCGQAGRASARHGAHRTPWPRNCGDHGDECRSLWRRIRSWAEKNGWREATHRRGRLFVVECFLALRNPQLLAVSKLDLAKVVDSVVGICVMLLLLSRSSVMDEKPTNKVPGWQTYSRDQKVVLEHVSLFWHITVLRATLHYQSFALACFCLVQFCLILVSDLLVCFSHCFRYRLQQSPNIGFAGLSKSKHRKQGKAPFTEWTFRWEFYAPFSSLWVWKRAKRFCTNYLLPIKIATWCSRPHMTNRWCVSRPFPCTSWSVVCSLLGKCRKCTELCRKIIGALWCLSENGPSANKPFPKNPCQSRERSHILQPVIWNSKTFQHQPERGFLRTWWFAVFMGDSSRHAVRQELLMHFMRLSSSYPLGMLQSGGHKYCLDPWRLESRSD